MLPTAPHLRHAQQIHAGARALRMRRLSCMGSTTPQDSTCRSCEPFAWQRSAVHKHVHVICIIFKLHSAGRCYQTTSRPACAPPSSGIARDGMPSRFLTASHCVSHLLLHSACVMRMCCGVGLSMAGLSHYITNKHDLSRVQLLLRYSTSYDGIFNGTVRTSCS